MVLGGYLALVLCGFVSMLLVTQDDPSPLGLVQQVALPPWAGAVEAAAGAAFALPHALLESIVLGGGTAPAAGSAQEVALVTAVARRLDHRASGRPSPGVTS